MEDTADQRPKSRTGGRAATGEELIKQYSVITARQISAFRGFGFTLEQIRNLSLLQWDAYTRAAALKVIDEFRMALNSSRSAQSKSVAALWADMDFREECITFGRKPSDEEHAERALSAKIGASMGAPTSNAEHNMLGIEAIDQNDLSNVSPHIRDMIENADALRKQQGGTESESDS